MTTATRAREAASPPVASRRQVRLARLAVAALAAGAVAGAIALEDGAGDGRQSRFAVPHLNDARVVKGAGTTFGDPQVVKGARGGSFDDPVVRRKGAGGAPIR